MTIKDVVNGKVSFDEYYDNGLDFITIGGYGENNEDGFLTQESVDRMKMTIIVNSLKNKDKNCFEDCNDFSFDELRKDMISLLYSNHVKYNKEINLSLREKYNDNEFSTLSIIGDIIYHDKIYRQITGQLDGPLSRPNDLKYDHSIDIQILKDKIMMSDKWSEYGKHIHSNIKIAAQKTIEKYSYNNHKKAGRKKNISTILQIDIETGEILDRYLGIKDVLDLNEGFSKSGLVKCLNGQRQQYKGYIWKYSE